MKSDGRMSECRRIAALLPELLDGGLAGAAERAAEAHLEGCAACSAERDALLRTLRIVAERPGSEPGEAFYAAMRRNVASELAGPARANRRPRVLRPAWQAGFAATAMLVALLIWQPWQAGGGDFLAQLESAGLRSLEELGASGVEPGVLLSEESGATGRQLSGISDMIDELDDGEVDRLLSALRALKG